MPSLAAIRTLFLHPRPTYPLPDAAALLGMRVPELAAWMESGEVEGVESGDGVVLPWEELVSVGMELWSQEVVEAALGADVARALPELLRLTELEVRLPRMEVVVLERVAALDGKSVSAVLARELLDLVSVHAPWLSAEVPGFAEALCWPEGAGGAAGA
ncbi:MAG: hypothetical protein ACXWN1_06590 [Thermoanaerobaculia bacterium]